LLSAFGFRQKPTTESRQPKAFLSPLLPLAFCATLFRMSQTIGGFGLKGPGALIVAILAIIGLAIYARSFFLIVVAAAAAAVIILHFWNKRPVKTHVDEQVRLHLNDDLDDHERK
jgi:cbb3-type cytochrome oxidase subunit 3